MLLEIAVGFGAIVVLIAAFAVLRTIVIALPGASMAAGTILSVGGALYLLGAGFLGNDSSLLVAVIAVGGLVLLAMSAVFG